MKYLVSREVVGDKLPILCNQENFILRENTYKIIQALPNFQVVLNPAVKFEHDNGRPKNGMFIAFPSYIKNSATDVSPTFWRIQAVKFKFGESVILLINSYFPTDNKRLDNISEELEETISHVRNVITANEFDSLLWAGDINVEFLRDQYINMSCG